MGVNAEYAAMLGLQAANDLRETFQEKIPSVFIRS